MSAKYPTVPNVPGVPALARPDALLTAIQAGTAKAAESGTTALGQLGVDQISEALASLNTGLASAADIIGPAEQVFSANSEVVVGVRGAISNAESAIEAIGSGDISGAITATQRLVQRATSAFRNVLRVISPGSVVPTEAELDVLEADLTNQWGMYTQAGVLAAPADTVVGFENVLDARISDYPVENGGFASYNKVITPYEIRFIMTKGGTVDERQAFLKAVQDAWTATTLYNFVTPECVYLDMNVVGVRQQRAADRGNGLMALDVTLRKVRQTATLAFTATKEATGEDVVNKGSVQATAKPAVQQYAGAAK